MTWADDMQPDTCPQVLFDDGGHAFPLTTDEVVDVVCAVLYAEGITRACSVSISCVDTDEMQALNAQWRGIDAPTDVLSFACDDLSDQTLFKDAPAELGDVILAPAIIAAQAPQFGNTEAQEFRLLLVHGLFHLLGYDHVDEKGALIMEARELEVLQTLAKKRGEDPNSVRIGPTTRHADDDLPL